MNLEEILFEIEEGVALVTLNRPNRFNALTTQMYREFSEILDHAKRDDKVKVMIITGAGKGFCAGSDVSARLAHRLEKGGEENRFETLRPVGDLALDLANFEKPLVAAINGVAVGAGLSIALSSDIRLASEKARFGAVWVRVGLIPDVGATYYLPRIVGNDKAMELAISGEIIDAKEALKIGLVTKIVSHDELPVKAKELAAKIANGPAVAIELTKRGLLRSRNNDLKTQLDYESYAQNICRQTKDHEEGVRAFLEKREPKFKGI